MEMSPLAGTPQETIARLLFELCQLLQRLKRALWRCVSPVSDGQDCLCSKYPAHPADVVGLIGLLCEDSELIQLPPCCLWPFRNRGLSRLAVADVFAPFFLPVPFTWFSFSLTRTAWPGVCRLIE